MFVFVALYICGDVALCICIFVHALSCIIVEL